ncbi:MAG: carbohydrate kinase family protein [bacterium]
MKKQVEKKEAEKIYDAAGIGFCVSDYQCLMERFPKPDEKTEAKRLVHQGGAPVPTAFVALAKWKMKTAFIGIAGDDEDGHFIRDEMERFGVDTSKMILSKDTATKRAFVLIDTSAGTRNVILIREKPKALPAYAASPGYFPQCRVFHTDGRETDVVLKAMKLARKRGAQTVIDAGNPRDRMEEVFAATDHFVASHDFIRDYYGARVKPEAAVLKMLEQGPRVGIVTLAEDGCVGATADGGIFRIRGHRRPGHVIDTTGAGDVFHGGYIYGVLRGWTAARCAAYANAAAFLSTGAVGARDGIPKLREVLALMG